MQNKTVHVYTETKVYSSTGSCDHYIHYFTCKCGYQYTYTKPHQVEANWHGTGSRLIDYKACVNCGTWMYQNACQDASGKRIGCNNPGTCVRCGYTATKDTHYLRSGTCVLCGKTFFKETSGPTVTYSSDYSTCTITFTITPLDSSCTLSGAESYGWTATPNWSSRSMSSVLNSDGSRTFTQKIAFNTSIKADAYVSYGNSGGLEYINGVNAYEAGYPSVRIWYDHVAPVQNDVIQTDQASSNGWATIKQLTLSGTENNSDIVRLTISDKITGEKYISRAAVPVNDGKYSYTCTPPIEGDASGRTYVVTAVDRIGNISTKEFTVSKTDGSAPALKSGTSLSYTDWTHTPKNISLSFYDFGAGGVMASLDNQTSYQELAKSGEYYIWNKSFGNQVGTTDHKLYVKDSLGNATVYTLMVGNVDTNTYSITYNLDGSTATGLKTTYTVEDTFTLPQVSKTGYTFLGYVGSNGSDLQKTVTVSKGTRGNLNYTAKWKANSYRVSIDPNGGIFTKTDTSISENPDKTMNFIVTYMSGNYYDLGIIGERPGYTFKGIYTAPSGGVKLWNGKGYNGTCGYCLKDGIYWDKYNKWIYAGDVKLYAQWEYNPVSVKVPQVLTGDKSGNSSFRIKCDDIKAGNIKVDVPSCFLYKQNGKTDVQATVTRKSGSNVITPSNKSIVYSISTNGLSAGSWNGSFNIDLMLTKE